MVQEKRNKKTLRNDIILIASILGVSVLFALIVFLVRDTGSWVVVSIDGEDRFAYPLSEDITVVIPTGKDGTKSNTLVIKDNVAYVSDADCPDGICVSHRPISFDGESIICIPNKTVISISDERPMIEEGYEK